MLPWFGCAVLALAGCELPPTLPPEAPSSPAPPTTRVAPITPDRAIDAGSSADKKSDVLEIIDPREWFAAHGAKQALDEYDSSGGCSELVVGVARDAALLCTDVKDVSRGHDDTLVYRVVTHQIVRLVRAGKIVTALDVETRLESLDGPVAPPGKRTRGIVELTLSLAADGMSAIVVPFDPESDCRSADPAGVTSVQPDDDAQTRAWVAFDDQWIKRICKGRGTYAWNGHRFSRGR